MNKKDSRYKFTLRFQAHSVTVDLRRILAINHPNHGDKYFRVYFSADSVWNVGIDQHDALYEAWLGV